MAWHVEYIMKLSVSYALKNQRVSIGESSESVYTRINEHLHRFRTEGVASFMVKHQAGG